MRSFAMIALFACLFATGCVVPFPHSRVHDLGVIGRVVDNDTGNGVREAKIESISDEQTGSRISFDTTDSEGRFVVTPTRRMHGGRLYGTLTLSIWPDFDMPAPMRRLVVSAAGYQTSEFVVTAYDGDDSQRDLNRVPANLTLQRDTLQDCEIRLSKVVAEQPIP